MGLGRKAICVLFGALLLSVAAVGVASARKPALGLDAAPFPQPEDPPVMKQAGIQRARWSLNWSFAQPTPPGKSSASTSPDPMAFDKGLLPQCLNFRDDDGDGLIDGSDPGCSSPLDNSEANGGGQPPPPPNGGKYNWTYADIEVQRLAQSGITSLPVLIGTPNWLASRPLIPPTANKRALAAWKEFVAAAARRYGPKGSFWSSHRNVPYRPIRYWQIWNEPNYPETWEPRVSPRAYVRLLKVSAKALHSVSPKLKVVLAGMGPGASKGGKIRSDKFLARLYRAHARHYFDVAAVHTYGADDRSVEDQIRAFAHVMKSHRDRHTPLWVTEVGWSSSHSPGHRWAVGTEARQAELLRGLLHFGVTHSRALHLGAIYWFDWKDVANVKPGLDFNFGLRRSNGTAKPSFDVVRHYNGG